MRYVITVTRYEQEIVDGTYYGNDRVASVQVTECADRAELLRELEAHGATAAERRADSFVYTHGRYRREWAAVADEPAVADDDVLSVMQRVADETGQPLIRVDAEPASRWRVTDAARNVLKINGKVIA